MTDEIGPPPEAPAVPTQTPAEPRAVSPPIPARPVSGAVVASAWGTDVHDRTYRPKGVIVYGTQITNPTNYANLPIDAVVAGDAAFARVASDDLIIPAGMDGLYLVSATVQATALGAAEFAWAELMLGANDRGGCYFPPSMTGNNVPQALTAVEQLTAGQTVYIRSIHTGSTVKITIARLALVRIGDVLA